MITFTLRRSLLLPALFFALCLLTGCLGPHKIDKWVAKHYADEPIDEPRQKSEQLAFVSKLPAIDEKVSHTEKNRSHLLPLLFYWKYDYSWSSTINPEIPMNNLMNSVKNYAGHGLKAKLGGNHLELTIQQLPHGFILDDHGQYFWFIYGFGVEHISVEPQPADMVVSYRLLNANNEEVKKGTITVADPNQKKPLRMFHSLKKTTWQYLEQYDANIASMSKELVNKIAAEL